MARRRQVRKISPSQTTQANPSPAILVSRRLTGTIATAMNSSSAAIHSSHWLRVGDRFKTRVLQRLQGLQDFVLLNAIREFGERFIALLHRVIHA